MLSNAMQKIILQIHDNPFGIYANDQNVYIHNRSFYRAIAYLEKHGILDRTKIPIVNKTRIALTLNGKLIATILEEMREVDIDE